MCPRGGRKCQAASSISLFLTKQSVNIAKVLMIGMRAADENRKTLRPDQPEGFLKKNGEGGVRRRP
jgi:hypothetical protein